MKLAELMEADMDLRPVNRADVDMNMQLSGGYCSDLLSQVMASAAGKQVWVTVQNHMNIIAVATIQDIRVVIICEGREMADDVIARADEESVVLLTTPRGAYELCSTLGRLGL